MKSYILGLFFGIVILPTLHAQTATDATAGTNVVASPVATDQAPDVVINKLSGMVHAGKYAEAQQLTTGLLLAYPDDQRLIKGKALLDKAFAAQTANTTPAQPPAAVTGEQLSGIDKVEYDSLIELGREAQQTTDIAQQKTLLQRFMDESGSFLQKHPDKMLIWQLRAASALTLNDMLDGYKAGQKLLAAGAVDNDPTTQHLLTQLNLKGWLDKQKMEAEQKQKALEKQYDWLLGTWDVSWSLKTQDLSGSRGEEEFQMVNSTVNGFEIDTSGGKDGVIDESGGKSAIADLRGTILDGGEIKWECFLPASNPHGLCMFRYYGLKGQQYAADLPCRSWWYGFQTKLETQFQSLTNTYSQEYSQAAGYGANIVPIYVGFAFAYKDDILNTMYYPSGWLPVISCVTSNNTMTIVIPSQSYDPASKKHYGKPVTLFFQKNSSQLGR